MSYQKNKAKRILKSELIRRGISNANLALLLREYGLEETKSSIDSKISRGTFSANFFLQCLIVIGCRKIEIEENNVPLYIAAEQGVEYNSKKDLKLDEES